jgi:uncharacterized protein
MGGACNDTGLPVLLLTFLPFYFAIIAANLDRTHAAWRWVTYATLITINLMFLGGGLLAMLASELLLGRYMPVPTPSTGTGFADTLGIGFFFFLSGAIGMTLLIPGVAAAMIRALRLKLDADNLVHQVALVLAVWLIGGTIGQMFFLTQLSVEQFAADNAVTMGALWEQGIAFVLFAILGVGLGLRRGLGETLERLGVTMMTPRQFAIALGVTVAALLWDSLLSFAWQAVSPDSYERISGMSELLFADLITPLGALSIGLTAGIGEELLFRGAIQPRFGLWLTTLLFTVGHTQYELTPALFSVFLIGLVLGIVRQRENTTTAILIHVLYNTSVVVIELVGRM